MCWKSTDIRSKLEELKAFDHVFLKSCDSVKCQRFLMHCVGNVHLQGNVPDPFIMRHQDVIQLILPQS